MGSKSDPVRILVVGFGSAGQRHAENFTALGCDILVFDTRPDRKAYAKKCGYSVLPSYTPRVDTIGIDAGVVATPTGSHFKIASDFARAGIPVLVEKPITVQLDEALRLAQNIKKNRSRLMLGYSWRWWPPIKKIKEIVMSNDLGRALHVDMFMSANLADWHPWEKYEDFFMAHADQGGGALLDESHWIDLMVWFFGTPTSVFAKVVKKSDLNISSDDTADILCFYSSGLTASVHLDIFGRPHRKTIRIVFSAGLIEWSADPHSLKIWSQQKSVPVSENHEGERNDMFIAEARDFLKVLDGETSLGCGIQDGVEVMKILEAARSSSLLGKEVYLEGQLD